LIIGIAVGLVVAGAGIGVAASHGSSKGSISLPGTLLGLPKYTGPGAKGVDARLTRHVTGKGELVHVVAASYVARSGRAGFVVAGGVVCDICTPKSASKFVKALVGEGFAGARSFPPGPDGGALVCFSEPFQGGTDIACKWADAKTGGTVIYSSGSASGLADAAAKTNRIRAVIEH
jgi:hypothetical protein